MSRTFYIKVDAVEYKTMVYEVEADSFDAAREKYDYGYAELFDEDWHDTEETGVDSIECECGSEEYSCECSNVDEEFFVGMGL
jgi:hypothetical protein